MSANSRIVWSPETGWADNGPESTLTLDERGRIAIEPTNYVITFADETSYLVEVSICPACGEPIDYCQGHGEIGDPDGFAILEAHDNDDHGECHQLSECQAI
jgi:hypothetical protein